MKLLTAFLILDGLGLAADAPKAPDPQVAELKLQLATAKVQALYWRSEMLRLAAQVNIKAAQELRDGLACEGGFTLASSQDGVPFCKPPEAPKAASAAVKK